MTLIECFSDSLVENIMGCLRLRPDKLILLGDGEQMRQPSKRCQTILQRRGLRTRMEPLDIRDRDMMEIARLLSGIVRKEESCVIDLSGGDELVIMAVGALVAGMDSATRQRVSVQKYDSGCGVDVDCDCDGRVVPGRNAALTVEEQIFLYGGIIHPSSYQPPMDCTPRDLEPLWAIVSAAPREWNRAIAVLSEFESRSHSKTEICLSLGSLRNTVSGYDEKEKLVLDLLDRFQQRGIIHDRSSRGTLRYTYTSPIFRHCTQKAGNVLEVKTLLEARVLKDNGAPFFRDCQMSVNIDWDGVVHHPAERVPETRNEVDLILTRGLTPLFISCKNGDIGEEELYKLHTVASRFGGPNARKMLIAAELEQRSDRAYAQRARDMGICLVKDAAELDRNQWRSIFADALK